MTTIIPFNAEDKIEQNLNLCEKLIQIRKCVPYLQKDTTGYKYSYVSGASVLGHIQGAMNELGVLLFPSVTNRAMSAFDNDYVVEGDIIMTWMDAATGERLEVPFLLFGKQNDPSKAFGSGLTYSERYFLLKFFNIPTDDEDPDRFQNKINKQTNIQASTKSDHKKKDFVRAIEALSDKIPLLEFEKLVSSFGVATYKKITDRTEQESFFYKLQAKIKEQDLPFEKPE